jgi:hypothetical protein
MDPYRDLFDQPAVHTRLLYLPDRRWLSQGRLLLRPAATKSEEARDDLEGGMVQQALKRRLVNQFHCQANGFEPTNSLRGDGKAYHFTRVINLEGGKYVSFSDRLATPPSRINRLT